MVEQLPQSVPVARQTRPPASDSGAAAADASVNDAVLESVSGFERSVERVTLPERL